MTECRNVEERLSLLVDGLLTRDEEAAVRAHVARCETCRQIVDDLVQITAAARLLGPIEPPARVQHAVVAAIGTSADRKGWARGGGMRGPWAAIAATLVAATAAAVWLTHAPALDAPEAAATDVVESVSDELTQAARHYERAIAELESIVPAHGQADPELASVVRASVGVLDRAITESRRALLVDPTNEPARASLFEALRRKVDLLQATALLIEESQRDGAAAAPFVRGRQL